MIINADGNYEFSFKRKPAVMSAYGKEFSLPVRNTEFLDKLITAERELITAKTPVAKAEGYKAAIALFIGEAEAEQLFPADEIRSIDIDELQAFFEALAEAVKEQSKAVIRNSYTRE